MPFDINRPIDKPGNVSRRYQPSNLMGQPVYYQAVLLMIVLLGFQHIFNGCPGEFMVVKTL